ncbi:MAG: diguanylate cyclase [Longimicrobiales bacterium]
MVRDALTGVYAKVALLERLEEEVHRGRRYGEPFSILMLDVDHFKSVNDAFGHARGDAALTEFVARVQNAARNSDVLFRYGGDEFVLFLPRTAHDQATILAGRLVEQIAGLPFAGQPPLSLTVSVGVATLPVDGSTAEELLARADARMYEAKRDGRARVVAVDLARDAELMLDESSRLIERLDALDRANRFFDSLPSTKSGVLRVAGTAGSGRSRVLRELEKLAALRGHRVLSLVGRPERSFNAMEALREASKDAAELPATLTDSADVAEALRRALSSVGNTVTTITIDNVNDVDRASLAAVRALLAGARSATAVGVIHTGSDVDPDPASPDIPLRDTIELRPLSRDGVRAWMRSIFHWEPPSEFVEWVHDQSGGLPGSVRQILLHLVGRRLLVRDDTRWTLAEGFRVLGGGIRTDLSVPEPRGLHVPSTHLLGREGPLRQLLRLIRTTRLVTVSGPGGSGKTRLAIEAALESSESFRDGVAFVVLDTRLSSHALATAIATTLDVRGLPGADPWIPLARELRLRKMLLVLDGFDGSLDAANKLEALLEYSPDLRILVTARSGLQLSGEWVFHLEGLRVPKGPDPERARGFSAVHLFTERALAVNPHFSMADADAPSVSRVCQLLDGSPLAIEIAAAQTATLSCREIAHDLEATLEGLSSYLPAAPPDLQRFRAAMEQTWRLLSEESRSVLRRASVFEREFDALAAVRILDTESASLDVLVASALLTRSDGRFAVQPLVREYAHQKLDEFSRDRHATNVAFATHYLELARELGDQLQHPVTAAAALRQFTLELPNIRKAWTFALADEQHTLIMSGGRALFELFDALRYRADAEALFDSAVSWLEAASPSFSRADERMTEFLLARHGAALLHVGRIEEARRRLAVALARARRLGLVGEESFCLRYLALVEQASGNAIAAEEYARGGIALARRSATATHALILALRDAAEVALTAHDRQRAVEYLLEAVGVEGASTAKPEAWLTLLDIAEQLAHQGNLRVAAAVLLQVLNDESAQADVHTRAHRLLDSMRPVMSEFSPAQDSHHGDGQATRPSDRASLLPLPE